MKIIEEINDISPDIIIVGAGITGCTVANIMGNKGWKVLILEKRDFVGGNCSDFEYDNYYVHKYGPHIFHTSNETIWNYIHQFTAMNNFVNTPLVRANGYPGVLFNLPFNMNLFARIFGETSPNKVRSCIQKDIKESCKRRKIDRNNPKNLEEQAIALVGEKIYEGFIHHYTEKQWGKKCTELDASIIKRLPLRYSYNNNYFNDQYQGIPMQGYTNMMEVMLNLENIYIKYNFNINKEGHRDTIIKYCDEHDIPLVYTGPIDEFFDFEYGKLEWRTVEFVNKIKNVSNFQGNAVVNYAVNDVPYTRCIEHKHFNCIWQDDIDRHPRTLVTYEYSTQWKPGMEPFYAINNDRNNDLVLKYQQKVDQLENVYMIGRLAEYKYKDMAPSIEDAVKLTWELSNWYNI